VLTNEAQLAVHDSSPISSVCPTAPRGAGAIEIDADGRWFKDASGRLVLLDRTRVMRRLVSALVRRYVEAPGEAMTTEELFRAAWPNHDVPVSLASLQSRVYMTLSRLRAFGLAGVIVCARGGYRISPDVTLHVKTAACADGVRYA
jgi:hypothetical protein